MVNFRIISKIIGSLLFIEAFFMSWCAIMAIVFHEDDQVAFLMSMLVTSRAPRDTNSKETAPVPEKRSKTEQSS